MKTDVRVARESWSSKVGFLFAAIGAAVGIGVLWKFPYMLGQNGGGLFLLSYIVCIIVIGLPIFIGELLMGRYSERAAISAFAALNRKGDAWLIGGWLGVLSSFLIMGFYSVVAGWGFHYLWLSISNFSRGIGIEEVHQMFTHLQQSGGICLWWHFVFMAISMWIVLSGVRKGIENASRVMTKALFFLLLGLVIYSMTLPGFGQALHFVFYPDPKSFTFSSILEALGLALFTMSLGQGIMCSYGSYMKKTDNIPAMAGIVSVAVIISAILGALAVFPVVFSYGFEPSAGTGLVFQTLPYLFQMVPGGQILSIVFFSLFVFCAITSAIAFIEVVASNVMELSKLTRKQSVLIVASFMFVLGIPAAYAGINGIFPDWTAIYGTNYLETLDRIVTNWFIPLTGLLTALFIGWVWSREESLQEFVQGCRAKYLWHYWFFFIRWIVPVLILLVIFQKADLFHFS